jgi:hypothetical protein
MRRKTHPSIDPCPAPPVAGGMRYGAHASQGEVSRRINSSTESYDVARHRTRTDTLRMRDRCTAWPYLATVPWRYMYRFMLVVLALMPVACVNDTVAPDASSIAGRWVYRIERMSDGGQVSCSMITEDTLTLGHSQGTVTGTYAGGTITCNGADVESITFVSGTVVNGTLDPMARGAQTVAFDFGGVAWHHAGTRVGDQMSGTVTVEHAFSGKLGRLLLTGNWTAHRISVIPPPHPL